MDQDAEPLATLEILLKCATIPERTSMESWIPTTASVTA
jgi:hypothetical protein